MNSRITHIILFTGIIFTFLGNLNHHNYTTVRPENTKTVDQKVDSLMALMTLEEKVGQMNLYNGFWDFTGPKPEGGSAITKYDHLRKGWVGGMLNIEGR